MSVRVTSWVWEQSRSSGADRLVLLAIADYASDTGRDAYPSAATLAARTKMDKRTVQRSVRSLVDLGELKVAENAGPHGTNRYQVLIPRRWRNATPDGDTPPGDTPPPRQDATPNGRHSATPGGDTPGGVASDPERGGTRPPEPSLTHPVVTTTAAGSRNAPAGFAPRIIRAYVEAARNSGIAAPEEAQTRVERSARSLLAQGFPPDDIENAARNAAHAGWTDLATQLQRDTTRANPTRDRPSTSDRAFQAGINLAERLEQPDHKAIR